MSQVNAHYKVTSTEEYFKNQACRVIHSVDTKLFPQPNLSSPNELKNKVAMVARMEVVWGLSNMNIHSPKPTWLQPWLSVQCASSRDQHLVPNMAPFPGVISQLLGGRLITLDRLHHERGSILFLLE